MAITVPLAILFVNLIGLALVFRRVIPSGYLLARAGSPAVLCLALYGIEHLAGGGNLSWLRFPSTGWSLWLIWKERAIVRANWVTELVFVWGFGIAFAFGFAFPNIDGQSENLADLALVRGFLTGERLPPPDLWLPPHRMDVYYGFQFYSAALLGRIMGLDAGTTYRISLCLMVALTILCAAGAAFWFGGGRRRPLLVLLAFAFGGTGATLIAPLMTTEQPALSHGMRFIGGLGTPSRANTELGKWIVQASQIPTANALQLPAETFGYLVRLGDLHPPMAGFFLLALALLCIAAIDSAEDARAAPALLAATIPLTAAANPWNLPLQCLLVAGWLLHRLLAARAKVPWLALAIGAAAASLFVLPFLLYFVPNSQAYGVHFRLVPAGEHTPVLLGLIIWFPFLLLLGAGVFSRRGSAGAWCCFWGGLLALTECFYADDVYGGRFNRFNSTLKWWPWIMAGMTLTLGPLTLTSPRRLSRWAGAIALLAIAGLAVPLAADFMRAPKPDAGQIRGDGWIRSDSAENSILEFLAHRPPAIVLQRLDGEAFSRSPALVIFAGHTPFLGWPAHEKLWRAAHRAEVEGRSNRIKQFYLGGLPDSARWLRDNTIAHVLWLKSESALPERAWAKIDEQLRGEFSWREHQQPGDARAGVWSRRQE